MHSLLLYLNSACKLFGISSGQALVACNNSMVISLCKYHGSSPPPDTSHLDLVRAIWALRNTSPLSLEFRHVRGHQDDLVAVSRLDPLAQLNVHADTLVKAHLHQLIRQNYATSTLPLAGETWSCWIGPTKVIHDPHCSLQHHLGRHAAKTFLIQKQLLSTESFELVDWESCKTTTASLLDQLSMWPPNSSVATARLAALCSAASNGTTLGALAAQLQMKPHNMCSNVPIPACAKCTMWALPLYDNGSLICIPIRTSLLVSVIPSRICPIATFPFLLLWDTH